jgi:hypothetical protein
LLPPVKIPLSRCQEPLRSIRGCVGSGRLLPGLIACFCFVFSELLAPFWDKRGVFLGSRLRDQGRWRGPAGPWRLCDTQRCGTPASLAPVSRGSAPVVLPFGTESPADIKGGVIAINRHWSRPGERPSTGVALRPKTAKSPLRAGAIAVRHPRPGRSPRRPANSVRTTASATDVD